MPRNAWFGLPSGRLFICKELILKSLVCRGNETNDRLIPIKLFELSNNISKKYNDTRNCVIFVDSYQKSFYSVGRWGAFHRHPENYFWRKR
jgi:hypothetical protein